jgi:nitrate reductase gamma subunit
MDIAHAYAASPLLSFAEDKLQIIALTFMGLVYILKIRWILGFKAGKERQAPTGNPQTTAKQGAVYSLFNIFMPWSMPSTRHHPLFYLQFGVFHVAVATSIAMSIVMPYWPGLISSRIVVLALRTLFGLGCLVGLGRFVRRVVSPYIRAISTPDDYFAVALLTVWLAFAFMAAPNNRSATEFWLLGYFLLTAFFLIYVPFSKISHYIFYPFTRWYLGKTLGHRGVYPLPFNPGNDPLARLFTRVKPVEGK